MTSNEYELLWFENDGKIPNNEYLPLIIYKQPFEEEVIDTTFFRSLFRNNLWTNCWEDSIFPYHHFHSTAHEVLGVTSGNAVLLVGGDEGKAVYIKKGDVIIIPAGVGHKKISSSLDFNVVGAYPLGQDWDLRRPNDYCVEIIQQIDRVCLPDQDPVFGDEGLIHEKWWGFMSVKKVQ